MPMIEMKEVSFRYKSAAASAFSAKENSGFVMRIRSLKVLRGERIALVGPSGSGKTTLLSLVAGILQPDFGTVRVDGQEISGLGDSLVRQFRISRIGQVFQSFELLDYLSILENVMLPWYLRRDSSNTVMSKANCRRRAQALLADVGLAARINDQPGHLSQGEQQRVAVCRAMLNHPPLILADEPTGNLDQDNKQTVVDLLLQQARRHDSTLLMVTHDQSLLDRFASIVDICSLSREGFQR